MSDKIHFFKDENDFISFFDKMAKNNNEELSDAFVFEGNSAKEFEWIKNVVAMVGANNVGVEEDRYNTPDIAFIDTVFININEFDSYDANTGYIDLKADEVALSKDGIISLWWD